MSISEECIPALLTQKKRICNQQNDKHFVSRNFIKKSSICYSLASADDVIKNCNV